MSATTRIDKALADVQKRIDNLKTRYDAELADLRNQKTALLSAKNVVTPDVEAALDALANAGIHIKS